MVLASVLRGELELKIFYKKPFEIPNDSGNTNQMILENDNISVNQKNNYFDSNLCTSFPKINLEKLLKKEFFQFFQNIDKSEKYRIEILNIKLIPDESIETVELILIWQLTSENPPLENISEKDSQRVNQSSESDIREQKSELNKTKSENFLLITKLNFSEPNKFKSLGTISLKDFDNDLSISSCNIVDLNSPKNFLLFFSQLNLSVYCIKINLENNFEYSEVDINNKSVCYGGILKNPGYNESFKLFFENEENEVLNLQHQEKDVSIQGYNIILREPKVLFKNYNSELENNINESFSELNFEEIINLVRKVFKNFFDLKQELLNGGNIENNLENKHQEFGQKFEKEIQLFQHLFKQPNYLHLLKDIFYLELEEKNQKLLSAIKFEKEDLRKGKFIFFLILQSLKLKEKDISQILYL